MSINQINRNLGKKKYFNLFIFKHINLNTYFKQLMKGGLNYLKMMVTLQNYPEEEYNFIKGKIKIYIIL
jgi:hypothetical protein